MQQINLAIKIIFFLLLVYIMLHNALLILLILNSLPRHLV